MSHRTRSGFWAGPGVARRINPLLFDEILFGASKIVSNDSTDRYFDLTIKSADAGDERSSNSVWLAARIPPQPGESGVGGSTPGIMQWWMRALDPTDPTTPSIDGIPDPFVVVGGQADIDGFTGSAPLWSRGVGFLRVASLLRAGLVSGGTFRDTAGEFNVVHGQTLSGTGSAAHGRGPGPALETETQGALTNWTNMDLAVTIGDQTGSDVATRVVFDLWCVSSSWGCYPDSNTAARKGWPWDPR